MSVLLKGRPLRRSDVWLRQAEKENAVYDPRSGALHLMNATAVAIWVLCDGQTEPEEMIEAICELTGLPRDVVEEDVSRTLHQFEHAEIITWRED